MKIKVLFLLLLLPATLLSQEGRSNSAPAKNRTYQLMELDSMPMFQGGYDSLLVYIDRHLVFPNIYCDASIQGRITCRFTVTEHGEIADVKVIQGLDGPLDDEVARVISAMPRWRPGKKDGRNVKTEYYLPVFCRLK